MLILAKPKHMYSDVIFKRCLYILFQILSSLPHRWDCTKAVLKRCLFILILETWNLMILGSSCVIKTSGSQNWLYIQVIPPYIRFRGSEAPQGICTYKKKPTKFPGWFQYSVIGPAFGKQICLNIELSARSEQKDRLGRAT